MLEFRNQKRYASYEYYTHFAKMHYDADADSDEPFHFYRYDAGGYDADVYDADVS